MKKKEIIEMIATLEQAVSFLKASPTDYFKTDLTIIEDAQQMAYQIGCIIETDHPESISAIDKLEQFCDNLYHFGEHILNEVPVEKDISKLENNLVEINCILSSTLTDKKIIVFLPYKASMWDSLESIYQKMIKNQDNSVLVMPIPYFERDESNNSQPKAHYEGDLFPSNIPITYYEDINLEQLHPDEIYIHNPYDEYNTVTFVHPSFFSSKLKNQTEKLIYVPYFIVDEIDINDDSALKNISHFINTAGVIYADEVIVQSENIKNAYVKVLSNLYGNKQMWRKKIIGSGSPKIEKLLSTKYEDLEIPTLWIEKATKSDGTLKPFVLYNVSISPTLAHKEKMIKKMEEVLLFFKRNKDSVTLIWRPHPLLAATLKSMLPELYVPFLNIVEKYKNEDWGIFDDSPDLDRAIVLSSAYYGSRGSVLQLYKYTKKPILTQTTDSEITYEPENEKIYRTAKVQNKDFLELAKEKNFANENQDFTLDWFIKTLGEKND